MLVFAVALLLLQNNRLALACPAGDNQKPLVGASLLVVRDDTEGGLAPDHERTVNGIVEQGWDLDQYRKGSSKIWLRCEYGDSIDKLTFEVPPTIHHCTKTLRADATRMVCK
jgi:hypothetical protein